MEPTPPKTDAPLLSYSVAQSTTDTPILNLPPAFMPPVAQETVPAATPVLPQKLLGMATLALLFFASAGLTAAYLTNAANANSQIQVAAAAATVDQFATLALHAQAAYVLDLTTGQVLYEHNPDVQLPLASLTKVALTLALAEVLSPTSVVSVPPHTTPDGAPKRLPDGSLWHAQDLIDFTLVSSSNEGAEVLASSADPLVHRAYPQSQAKGATLWRMNDLARALGLTHTYFVNTSGLDESPTQAGAYGSARDVAVLFAYAASTSPASFEGTSREGFVFKSIDGAKATVVNTDTIAGDIPGLVMGKTGSTELAGGNLAVIFDVGPARPIVAVVLHSTQEGRFEDMKKLVAAAQATVAQER